MRSRFALVPTYLLVLASLAAPRQARAADVSWISDSSGYWDVGANWSTGSPPGVGDNVTIDRPGVSITVTIRQGTADIASLHCREALVISGGALSLTANSEVTQGLTLSGGSLAGPGRLTVSGLLTWAGGTMSGSGVTVANAGMTIAGGGDRTLTARTLENGGTATLGVTLNVRQGAILRNRAGSVLQADGDIQSAGDGLLDNAGAIRSHGAILSVPLANTGTVEVQGGTVRLAGGGTSSGPASVAAGATLILGGDYVFTGDVAFAGAGTVQFEGSNITVSGNYAFSCGLRVVDAAVNVTGGSSLHASTLALGAGPVLSSVGGDGAITVSGMLSWREGGLISGSGTTLANGGMRIGPGARLVGRTLENAGTATFEPDGGSVELGQGAVFRNQRGALVILGDYCSIHAGQGGGKVENAGTIRATGADICGVTAPLLCSGAIEALPGATLTCGSLDLASGSVLRTTVTASSGSCGKLSATSLAIDPSAALAVATGPGDTPRIGDAFDVITHGTRSGTFDSVTSGWDTAYGPGGVRIVATMGPPPNNPPTPPSLLTPSDGATISELPFAVTLSATDADDDVLTYMVEVLQAGQVVATFDQRATLAGWDKPHYRSGETATLSLDDRFNGPGEYVLRAKAHDGRARGDASLTRRFTLVTPLLALGITVQQPVRAGGSVWWRVVTTAPDDLWFSARSVDTAFRVHAEIKQGSTVIASGNDWDVLLRAASLPPGEYSVGLTSSGAGVVAVRAGATLPVVEMNKLFVGRIYSRSGHDWAQMDVAAGIAKLDFTVETVGTLSQLVVWRGAIGSAETWQAEQSFRPPVRLSIPHPQAGRYYIRVYDSGRLTGSQVRDYSLLVQGDNPPPTATGITPDHGGNTGEVTITVEGRDLPVSAVVSLIPAQGSALVASRVVAGRSDGSLDATFDLSGAPVGVCDLTVKGVAGEIALPQAFTVEAGDQPAVWAQIVGANTIRAGRPVRLAIEYGNRGNVDVCTPVLSLVGPAGAKLTLDGASRAVSGRVNLLGMPGRAAPLRLAPGETHSLTATVLLDPALTEATFRLHVLESDGQRFDWPQFARDIRARAPYPAGYEADVVAAGTAIGGTCGAVLSGLSQFIGQGWSSLVQAYDFDDLVAYMVFARAATTRGSQVAPTPVLPSLRSRGDGPSVSRVDAEGDAYLWSAGTSRPDAPRTYVFVHGWNDRIAGSHFETMMLALKVLDPDANVVAVDWSTSAQSVLPNGAASRIGTAGQYGHAMLRRLGINPGQTMFIGHSFGVAVSTEIASRYRQTTGTAKAILALNNANPTPIWATGQSVPDLKLAFGRSVSLVTTSPGDCFGYPADYTVRLETPAGDWWVAQHMDGVWWLHRMLVMAVAGDPVARDALAKWLSLSWPFQECPTGPDGAARWDDYQYVAGCFPNGVPGCAYLPDSDPWSTLLQRVVMAFDPNHIEGPAGIDPAGTEDSLLRRSLMLDAPMRYRISYENVASATAPAQEVTIETRLDPDRQDLKTLTIGETGFGDRRSAPTKIGNHYVSFVDLRPTSDMVVRVEASADQTTGLVTWRFASLDPATGELTTDPLAGFLPPNRTSPEGEGFVTFSVMPKPGLPTGTEITAQATIVFDANAPIATNIWKNTVDSGPPTSTVLSLPAVAPTPAVTVAWAGQDDANGSGVRSYDVSYREDGGTTWVPWLTNTAATSGIFPGKFGHAYQFRCAATDNVGNTEAKTAADAQTVAGEPPALQAGLYMVGVPVQCENSDPLAAFGFTGGLWARYDPAANTGKGAWVQYTNDTAHYTWLPDPSTAPARAYWVKLASATKAAIRGTAADTAQPVSIALQPGWNQIGNPFLTSVNWRVAEIAVVSGGTTKTLAEAQTAGWIEDYAWGWKPNTGNPTTGAYELVHDPSVVPGMVDHLAAWGGYWVFARQACTLVLPGPTAASKPAKTRAATGSRAWGLRILADSPTGSAQAAIGVSASDRSVEIGPPPGPPTGDARPTVVIRRDGVALAADFRSAGTRRPQWDIEVTAPAAGGSAGSTGEVEAVPVTLRWPDASRLPRTADLILTDLQTNQSRYLRHTSSFLVQAKPGTTYRYRLETISRTEYLRITQAQVLGARAPAAGLSISYALTRDAQVSVRVLTGAGRAVRTLRTGADRGVDVSQVRWDGRDEKGISMPAGAYLIDIRATSPDGQAARAVMPAILVR